ncbi:MAG: AAA family ATPase, partial [Planktothrix sp.]
NISNCSSGQQETLPLVIILSTMPFIQSIMPFIQPIVGGQTIYIEEPEAHVFPTAQKYIVELIATVFNTNPDGLQFFITTHSPYILTATNNLLQAGLIYQDANDQVIEKLEKIVPRYKTLLTKDVAVYSLMDGFCKSIISEETGLIDTNIIDSVSEELAMEFDQLLDLI